MAAIMNAISKAVENLDDAQRARVLKWAEEQVGELRGKNQESAE
jgi:hypothetical protein